MAKTTAMASGVNKYRAVPVSSNTGTNTMQIESVATKVGTAICAAPSSTARSSGFRKAKIAVGVLDLDRRVVHQDADRQRQTAERHHVDRLSQQAQHAQRGENGQRNRDTYDQRAAPAPQEQQDHHARETGRDQCFPHYALNRGAHEKRLVEKCVHLQLRRHRGEDPGKRRLHGIHDRPVWRPSRSW